MSDLEKPCNRPYCNCVNVEPNFRAWYHTDEGQKEDIEALRNLSVELATLIAKVPAEGRCKALAQTKLQECVMWIKEGITKEIE